MLVAYDPTLVEAAVEATLRAPARAHGPRRGLAVRLRHRRALDRLYAQEPGVAREAAFRAHYLERFRELGLERWLRRCLDPFPALESSLGRILVETAAAENDEGAELYEDHDQRGTGCPAYLLIRIMPHRFREPDELARVLMFRLRMAADVLDSGFGFDPAATRPRGPYGGRTADLTQRLWELSARRRVAAMGSHEDTSIARDLRALLPRGARSSRRRFDQLLDDLGDLGCTFSTLVDRARELAAERGADGGGDRAGSRCPLCGFPTHAWATPETIARVETAVGRDFPAWSSPQGCCDTCADRYLLSAEVESDRRPHGLAGSSMAVPQAPGSGT